MCILYTDKKLLLYKFNLQETEACFTTQSYSVGLNLQLFLFKELQNSISYIH